MGCQSSRPRVRDPQVQGPPRPGSPRQLLNGQGTVKPQAAVEVLNDAKTSLFQRYLVIAVLGRCRSGKSTLLNNLLGTHFTVSGRPEDRQVGVWIARAPRPCFSADPCKDTVGLSLELTADASSSAVLGPEAQSALLALLTCDILLLNLAQEDLASLALFRLVVQVKLKLQAALSKLPDPAPGSLLLRPSPLLVVVRDVQPGQGTIQAAAELRQRLAVEFTSAAGEAGTSLSPDLKLDDCFVVRCCFLTRWGIDRAAFARGVASIRSYTSTSAAEGGLRPSRLIADTRTRDIFGQYVASCMELVTQVQAQQAAAATAAATSAEAAQAEPEGSAAEAGSTAEAPPAQPEAAEDWGKQLASTLNLMFATSKALKPVEPPSAALVPSKPLKRLRTRVAPVPPEDEGRAAASLAWQLSRTISH